MKNNNIKLKIFIKSIMLNTLAFAGYLMFIPLLKRGRKNKLIIIRYHSVNDFRRHEVNVKSGVFRRQMEFLSKHYQPVSLRRAVNLLRENKSSAKNSIVVTFDDGYKDNFYNAYEILKQFKIPATIFLVAGYVGTERILPHDIGDTPAFNYLLSWSEARKMRQDGIEFGSHTLSHTDLGRTGMDISGEITESKKIIEKELGSEVFAISYPFGLLSNFNHKTKEAARAAGYTCGCSAMNGVNDSKTDIFELRRIGIEASDNMFTFRAKLNGALDLLAIKDTPVFNRLLRIFNKLIGV